MATLCPINHYVHNKECFHCPEDTYNKVHHNYLHGNTSCDQMIYNTCNEYIYQNTELCNQDTNLFYDQIDYSVNIPIQYSVDREDIHKYCCNIQCKDYWKRKDNRLCSGQYKNKVGADEEYIINESGMYTPYQQCCESKTCQDWINDGNGCSNNRPLYGNSNNRIGYTEKDCCYSTCDIWKLQNIELCPSNQTIPGKVGWSVDECCVKKENICLFKEFNCPENIELNEEDFQKECDISECRGKGCYCPDTQKNRDICCAGNNKCKTLTCPKNYHLNNENLEKQCIDKECDEEKDRNHCCLENSKCITFDCPSNYIKKNKDEYCLGHVCSVEDIQTCCKEKRICKNMKCPDGFFNNIMNNYHSCYKNHCSLNDFNIKRCCNECIPVENSVNYKCTDEEDSYATECLPNYLLEDGICKQIEKENINVILSLDEDYNSIIIKEDIYGRMKNDICKIIVQHQEEISFEECMELIDVTNITDGSVNIYFTIKNDKNNKKIFEEDIIQIFKESTELPDLTYRIKKVPKISRKDDKPKCSSFGYDYPCPVNMELRFDSSEIYGNTDDVCCFYNITKMLQIFIPIGIGFIFFFYSLYKKNVILFLFTIGFIIIISYIHGIIPLIYNQNEKEKEDEKEKEKEDENRSSYE